MQFLTDLLTLRFFVTPYLMVLAYWAYAILLLLLATFVLVIWYKLNQHETTAAGIKGGPALVDTIPYSRPVRILLAGTIVGSFCFWNCYGAFCSNF